ncbi:MAG: phosphatidylglycerophosphatase A [Bacteroidales bacterium]|nr:phosphatidylglycerophosphatase A [Bacteroidales bacterium]
MNSQQITNKYRKPVPTAAERRRLGWVPKLLATSFGFGFLPYAPGTWGSIFGIILWLPLYLWCHQPLIFWVTLAATVVYFIAGTWASNKAEEVWGHDPVVACADETVGQWISLLPLSGVAVSPWWLIVVSLCLFRFFDIYKPLGIREMEKLPGGYGMMADDVLAGIYSAIILVIIIIFLPA